MIRLQKIVFRSGGQKITGTLILPSEQNTKYPGVIFFHGRGASEERYVSHAEKLVQAGIACLTFSFRGCGSSEGKFLDQTIRNGIEDAAAAYHFFVKSGYVDKKRIGICGRSFGGLLAAEMAIRVHIRSLALAAPAVHKRQWLDKGIERIPRGGIEAFRGQKSFHGTEPVRRMWKYRGNLLLIEHEKDEVIPRAVVEAYYDCAGTEDKTWVRIENAKHRLDEAREGAFTQIIADWFSETL